MKKMHIIIIIIILNFNAYSQTDLKQFLKNIYLNAPIENNYDTVFRYFKQRKYKIISKTNLNYDSTMRSFHVIFEEHDLFKNIGYHNSLSIIEFINYDTCYNIYAIQLSYKNKKKSIKEFKNINKEIKKRIPVVKKEKEYYSFFKTKRYYYNTKSVFTNISNFYIEFKEEYKDLKPKDEIIYSIIITCTFKKARFQEE